MTQVRMVRVYLSEDAPVLKALYEHLHVSGVRGATLFRGIRGFGHTGIEREASLLDMHFHLPVVLEFFDTPERVDAVLAAFPETIEAGRMVQWLAQVNEE
ncbi:hypothetical protein Lgee_2265 [Legionella geestiana]|uniref:Uncharacterized protein n=1 Tax=Legionella geestiana TaxID=45065 RepID=A0A0W0TGJ5_9GAMM|nr:DUF190 domain-containing protein [Legionella geestiana]KTC94737.1 hypothetical protein Lgee_2265 [Legionella geestiana]QBS12708.1 DUF190 domain-containing protein [Legionella geestiana]QDQ39576.1 DUF190 domain-containing protein [Legionella geestiana]STX54826.1 Uncharacterized ACR, COG1993 [Legionella geestiana]